MTRKALLLAAAILVLGGLLFVYFSGRKPAPVARGGSAPDLAGARPVAEIARSASGGRSVLFVGLDGGDWELLDRYIETGSMPNLARLVREGAGGTLETIHPPLSPLIWTTMMTGVDPLEHRILDFTRFNPESGVKEPMTSDERRAPAIWNMATYGGKRVAALGLWATFPAEAVNGLLVSDRLFSFLYQEDAPPAGAVYPKDREDWARSALDRSERAVGFSELKAYLPWLEEAEYDSRRTSADPYAHPVSALRRILVETRVYHELATDWTLREGSDLTVLYLQGTDTVGHVFAPYAPPRQGSIPQAEYDRYSRVPERFFRSIDRLLGEYRQIAEKTGRVLMIASDHGFRWGEGRPASLSSFAHATAAKWHRKEGIYLLWGSGIAAAPGHKGSGSVGQVCATLLSLLGLPPGRNVQDPPLPGAGALPESRHVDYRAYYKPPAPAPRAAGTQASNEEALRTLRALGYVGSSEAAAAPAGARGSTRSPGSYNNEGLILKDRGETERAIAAFERALALEPTLASALWNLSDLLYGANRDLDRSDALLVRAFASQLPEGTRYLIGRAIGYQRDGQVERSARLMSAAVAARPDEPEIRLFRGRYLVEQGNCAGALSDFQKATELAPQNAAAHASQGIARLCLGDRVGARRDFLRSLELEPRQPQVREYLKRL